MKSFIEIKDIIKKHKPLYYSTEPVDFVVAKFLMKILNENGFEISRCVVTMAREGRYGKHIRLEEAKDSAFLVDFYFSAKDELFCANLFSENDGVLKVLAKIGDLRSVLDILHKKGFDFVYDLEVLQFWKGDISGRYGRYLEIKFDLKNVYEIYFWLSSDLTKMNRLVIKASKIGLNTKYNNEALEFLFQRQLLSKKFFFNLDFIEWD